MHIYSNQNDDATSYTFRESYKFYSRNLSEYGMKYISLCYNTIV